MTKYETFLYWLMRANKLVFMGGLFIIALGYIVEYFGGSASFVAFANNVLMAAPYYFLSVFVAIVAFVVLALPQVFKKVATNLHRKQVYYNDETDTVEYYNGKGEYVELEIDEDIDIISGTETAYTK